MMSKFPSEKNRATLHIKFIHFLARVLALTMTSVKAFRKYYLFVFGIFLLGTINSRIFKYYYLPTYLPTYLLTQPTTHPPTLTYLITAMLVFFKQFGARPSPEGRSRSDVSSNNSTIAGDSTLQSGRTEDEACDSCNQESTLQGV